VVWTSPMDGLLSLFTSFLGVPKYLLVLVAGEEDDKRLAPRTGGCMSSTCLVLLAPILNSHEALQSFLLASTSSLSPHPLSAIWND